MNNLFRPFARVFLAMVHGFLFTSMAHASGDVNVMPVIPAPNGSAVQPGEYRIGKLTIRCASRELIPESKMLKDKLSRMGISSSLTMEGNDRDGVTLRIDKKLKQPESYRLVISPKSIQIDGADRAGVFYGIQTLLHQLSAARTDRRESIACMTVNDSPRFEWRGFMLDESRHFFGKEKLKQLFDVMAYYKLNKLHWHLTDSEGWRIEIKKYPKLTSIGGKGDWSNPERGKPKFYTQEDIKELIAYAAERHIEIIPEIDMPGHADASNRAYPEFSGGGFPRLPLFTFNPGKEETYAYLKDILSEVAQLFPSKYIHLGGDEVHFGNQLWPDLKEVKDLMKKENLKDIKEVEIWFNRRMAASAKELGKIVIGWDEYLSCGIDTKDSVIMWWRHDKPNILKQSLQQGYRTIMCPRRPLYFDFVQDASHTQGRKWGGACTLQQVYEFPNLKGLPANQHHLIMGMQANLWTDTSDTFERLDFMVFPRLCALAESAWTNDGAKDFASFNNRMEYAYQLFDALKIGYFDHRDPGKTPEPPNAKRNGKVIKAREDNQKK